MSPEGSGRDSQRPERSVTELAVDLTIAWLKRVEDTADGREPKEVVAAMAEFFEAIHHHKQQEIEGKRRHEGAAVH